MDLVISLPKTQHSYNAVFTVVDKFSKLDTTVLYETSSTAADIAQLFFYYVLYKFGMPKKIISNHDPRFASEFWTTLMIELGTKVGLSASYHLQTNG